MSDAAATAATTESATTTGGTTAATGTTTATDASLLTGGTQEAASTTTTETTEAGKQSTDNWRSAITDPELQKFAERIASPVDAVKVAYDLRKANGSMVRVPGENATDEDKAKFRQAIGAGADETAYVAAFPKVEGVEPTEIDKSVQGKVSGILHKHNVPVAAVPELHAAMAEIAQGIHAEEERVAKESFENSLASLKKEMGADFEASMKLANQALSKFGSPDLIAMLQNTKVAGQRLSDHPEMVRAFATIGRRMGEGTLMGVVSQDEQVDAQSKLNQIMRDNPPGTDRYRDPKVQQDIRRLTEMLAGTQGIVGAAGRTA